MEKVIVKVPATSANLGPGFDSLGCALTMYNTLTFEKMKFGLRIQGFPSKYRNARNLAVVAYNRTLKKLGRKQSGLKVSIETNIPVCRGLGSSAAIIVAGVLAANELEKGNLSKQEILEICTEIEGHPDNIAPALFGGLTASFVKDEKPYTVEYKINPKWHFIALIPDFKLSTHKARKALPKSVPFEDAVFNVSRVAALLKSLENGDEEILKNVLFDKLHQDYRSPLIEEYDIIEKTVRNLGAEAFYLSGAGPTLMAITSNSNLYNDIDKALNETLKNKWEVVPLEIDYNGATIE